MFGPFPGAVVTIIGSAAEPNAQVFPSFLYLGEMSVSALIPNELWLEIIGYLPQPHATARRMLLVSRTLYSLAWPTAHRTVIVTENNLSRVINLFADLSTSDGLTSGTAAQRICRFTEVLVVRTQKWHPTRETLRLFDRLVVLHSLGDPLLSILYQARNHALLPSLTEIGILEQFYMESWLPPTVKRISVRHNRKGYRGFRLEGLIGLVHNKQLEYIGLQIYDRCPAHEPPVIDDQGLEELLFYLSQNGENLRFVLHTRGRASEGTIWACYTRVVDDLDHETKRRVYIWRDTRSPNVQSHDTALDTEEDVALDIEDVGSRVGLWSLANPASPEDTKMS